MNLKQLEKKLDEHYAKISETITEYTDSFESQLNELVHANNQLQNKLNKSETKRQEAEAKAKEASDWERKYYRLKETEGSGKTKQRVKQVSRYTAYVQFGGRVMDVGTFDNQEDAMAAEKRAAKELAKT